MGEKRRARRNRDQKWKKVHLPTQAAHFQGLAERVNGLTSDTALLHRTIDKALARSNHITSKIVKKSEANFDDDIAAEVCKMYLSERRRMHIRVMTDPQAYMRATVSRDAGAVNTDLARQLITGTISAESQIAKATQSAESEVAAADNSDGSRTKLSRWAPMMMLTGPCARI